MNKLPTKVFSSQSEPLTKSSHFAELQTQSDVWFKGAGLKELFEEISPIKDYTGKDLELHFVDYYFDEPKYDENYTKLKDLTFEAPLRVKLKLINHRTGDEREQEVYFGDFPIMTDRGTFIINGVERVVISQLIRSAGVYFSANIYRGRKLFGAKVIPNRGVWLEFETDPDGFIGVKIESMEIVPIGWSGRLFSSEET